MTMLSMAGYNILPRHRLDLAKVEAQLRAQVQKPALCVVSHEPDVITRLAAASPGTVWIYRDSPPGHGTDDNIYETAADAGAYVRYLHSKAPPGAWLYLGNEPQNHAAAVSWTMQALDACDVVQRTGVVLNLFPGHPERTDWSGVYLPLLRRLSDSKHVLGLHEYRPVDDMVRGYLIGRCAMVNDVAREKGFSPPRIAITELGVLDGRATKLDSQRGYRAAGMSDAAAAAAALECYRIYEEIPNVIGTAWYCFGEWGDGMDIQHAEGFLKPLQTHVSVRPQVAPVTLQPDAKGTGKKVKLGEGATWLRNAPGDMKLGASPVPVGTPMTLYADTARQHGNIPWYWVEIEDGRAGWMGQWHADFSEQFISEAPPAPPPPPTVERKTKLMLIEISSYDEAMLEQVQKLLRQMVLSAAALGMMENGDKWAVRVGVD